MNIKDLKPGLLVRDGTAILQISHVCCPYTCITHAYSKLVTAQVLAEGRPLKPPPRTSVRSYTVDEVDGFKPATKAVHATLNKFYRPKSGNK